MSIRKYHWDLSKILLKSKSVERYSEVKGAHRMKCVCHMCVVMFSWFLFLPCSFFLKKIHLNINISINVLLLYACKTWKQEEGKQEKEEGKKFVKNLKGGP